MCKNYMLVGNCKMGTEEPLGFTIYEADAGTGKLTARGNYGQEISVGQQSWDSEKALVYAVDERWSQRGQTGGGGNAAVLRFDPETESLRLLSCQKTLAANPTYQCRDKTGRFLFVTHHTTENFVTRLRKKGESIDNEVCYDDCLLTLLKLRPDGTIDGVADVVQIAGNDKGGVHRFPHLHCVCLDRSGKFFLVTDKGLGKLYVYTIQDGKLHKVSEIDSPKEAEARYLVLDPEEDIVYCNFEESLFICSYQIDSETGRLTLLHQAPILEKELAHPMVGDLAIHPSGKTLYTTIRTPGLIAVLALDRAGGMMLRQTINCGGENPRGLCLSPDGRFLYAVNTGSATITVFSIGKDGSLTPQGIAAQGGRPGNAQIITFETGGR